jgi:hypothetical protein
MVFGWGYSGAGPHLLYQALVHAVDSSAAPATDGRFIDAPSSFYGWLTRQQKAVHSSAADKAAPGWAFRKKPAPLAATSRQS